MMIAYPIFVALWLLTFTTAEAKPITCVQVKAAVLLTGSAKAAEDYARKHGYTEIQIARAKRDCLKA
jgi:hypothetical protein